MIATIQALAARNIWSRNIFPFSMEGVVLYLPLWQEDMQGATLLSYDQNHQSCPVTGAAWESQGRTFDGVDDFIDCGSSSVLYPTTALTSLIWVKITADAGVGVFPRFLGCLKNDGEWRGYGIYQAENGHEVRYELNSNGFYQASIQTDTLNVWGLYGFTFNGATNSVYPYFNGTQGTLASRGAAITYTSPYQNLRIGTNPNVGNTPTGIIGEVFIDSRALSAAEIQQIYNATKWRYV